DSSRRISVVFYHPGRHSAQPHLPGAIDIEGLVPPIGRHRLADGAALKLRRHAVSLLFPQESFN
ncbi:MAG: hypothetical protein ACOC2F_06275, partial [Bacteroidota bacterium]